MTPPRRPGKKSDVARDAPVRGKGKDGKREELCGEKRRVHTAHPSGDWKRPLHRRRVLSLNRGYCRVIGAVKDEEKYGCEVENQARKRGGRTRRTVAFVTDRRNFR
ncbi:unnamed protein product [Lasius platythorax]|uniref:Uncharacterized protein n=1 Tax=Lasius platythorax TaxID=488582 RepID=A0AAV2P905_9HYME